MSCFNKLFFHRITGISGLFLLLFISLNFIFNSCFTIYGQTIPDSQNIQVNTKESGTIKIGLISSLSGPVGVYGKSVKNGVSIAINAINASGGINGQKVQLITYDDHGDSEESITLVSKLITEDKIVALIGPIISSTALTVAPLAEQNKIPMITPTATAVEVTKNNSYVFRAASLDFDIGKTMANFSRKRLGAKTAAIFYNQEDNYSVILAEAFKATFEEAGGKITVYSAYDNTITNFTQQLSLIKKNTPDVLFNPDYYNTAGLLATQVKKMGIKTTLLGGDGWDGIQRNYLSAAEGSYFLNHFSLDDKSPFSQNFIKDYKKTYRGEDPTALSSLGYEAAQILLAAIKKAQSTDSTQILSMLQATNLSLLSGRITLDSNGDPIKNLYVLKVEKGKIKLIEKFR